MRFDIVTLFPGIFTSFLKESILNKAQTNKKISFKLHNFRRFAKDKHRVVDDKPYGGGPGMVLKVDPIVSCLKSIKRKKKSKVILLTPKGKEFSQKIAKSLSSLDQIILICGRYEGFDERVRKFVDTEISVGSYITMGGEAPAMVITEAVSRLIPGVLGHKESIEEESFSNTLNYIEYPQYTRPPVYKGLKVPKVLISGHHKKITEWRQKNSKIKK